MRTHRSEEKTVRNLHGSIMMCSLVLAYTAHLHHFLTIEPNLRGDSTRTRLHSSNAAFPKLKLLPNARRDHGFALSRSRRFFPSNTKR